MFGKREIKELQSEVASLKNQLEKQDKLIDNLIRDLMLVKTELNDSKVKKKSYFA